MKLSETIRKKMEAKDATNLVEIHITRLAHWADRAAELEKMLLIAAEEEAQLWASEYTWSEESENFELLAARAAETCERWKATARKEAQA